MKFNITTRPVFVSAKYGQLIQDKGAQEAFRLYSKDVDAWFVAFEKELRDSLAFYSTKWHPRKDVEVAKRQALIDEIKQVLGE